MQPNNVFNLQRMQLYLQKHFTDHYRFYLLGMLAIFSLMTVIPVFMIFVTNDPFDRVSDLVPIYYIGLFFGGLLLTSRSFGELASKEKGVDFLMLPASQFEKFITLFLITTVGYLLFYHISSFFSFKIIESLQLAVRGRVIQQDYQFTENPVEKRYVYYSYLVLQAAFLLGATYYHKYSFIKTVLSVFVFLFGLCVIHAVLITCVFGFEGGLWKRSMPFVMLVKQEGGPFHGQNTMYFIPKWLQENYLFACKFLLAPILWTIAYFRLKDKEI